jgi:hypothetical protein
MQTIGARIRLKRLKGAAVTAHLARRRRDADRAYYRRRVMAGSIPPSVPEESSFQLASSLGDTFALGL